MELALPGQADALSPGGAEQGNEGSKLSSPYTGVVWNEKSQKWRATIKHQGKKIFLGNYSDELEAARAFDKAAIKFRGTGAKTNFAVSEYGDVSNIVGDVPLDTILPVRKKGRPRKEETEGPWVVPELDSPNPALDAVRKAIEEVYAQPLESFIYGVDDDREKALILKKQKGGMDWVRSQKVSSHSPFTLGTSIPALTGVRQPQQVSLFTVSAVGQHGLQPSQVQNAVQQLMLTHGLEIKPERRGPGRPKGSKNKAKEDVAGEGGEKAEKRPGEGGGTPPGKKPRTDVPGADSGGGRRFRGITFQSDKKKWRAQLSMGNAKKIHLGYYETPEMAARAYDQAALKHHGAGAHTNYPIEEYLSLLTPVPMEHVTPVDLHRTVLGNQGALQDNTAGHLQSIEEEGQEDSDSESREGGGGLVPTDDHRESDAGYAAYLGVKQLETGQWSADYLEPHTDGQAVHLGVFDTAELAARAYDLHLIKTYGTMYRTNFPLEQYAGLSSEVFVVPLPEGAARAPEGSAPESPKYGEYQQKQDGEYPAAVSAGQDYNKGPLAASHALTGHFEEGDSGFAHYNDVSAASACMALGDWDASRKNGGARSSSAFVQGPSPAPVTSLPATNPSGAFSNVSYLLQPGLQQVYSSGVTPQATQGAATAGDFYAGLFSGRGGVYGAYNPLSQTTTAPKTTTSGGQASVPQTQGAQSGAPGAYGSNVYGFQHFMTNYYQ